MTADPVVTYGGDVAGLATTKPGPGEKIDPGSAAVSTYAAHLRSRHDAALSKIGGGKKLYEYVYSYGGFAAKLTASQAARLRGMPDVVSVIEDRKVSVQTSSTPSFLGLDTKGGLWDQLGGPDGRLGRGAGEGIVIGVIDTGIWPTSASFADRDDSGTLFRPVPGFHGTCEPQATDGSWNPTVCNGKVVAARHFNAGWGGDDAIKQDMPWEFRSPRDYNGHGTHTGATAAGNHGVDVTGPAQVFGTVSGMAPRARVAVYKALWSTEDGSTAGGYTSDLVAAIDQAVADGVDVINYSVSGTTTDFLDPAEQAFLAAAEAGVFVAAAGGNDGPAAATVAHPSPWVTTVAAGTHNRAGHGSVTLGNGTTYQGASLTAEKAGPAPLVDATAVGLPDTDSLQLSLCYGTRDTGGVRVLDPAKVTGKIVICDRGSTSRTNKSLAVAEAGGVGMILTNVDENSVNADLHDLPTVHLPDSDRTAVKEYAASDGATATINQSTLVLDAAAPHVAAFSSRGPLHAADGDLLKPDVIAPGEDILAATAPPGAGNGADFGIMSGTSMAAPHVAGLAALLKDLHPHWSPMAIKSALMTSGSNVRNGSDTDPSVIFGQGAGHVTPNRADDPGLVFDSAVNDWLAFLCGTAEGGVPARTCDRLAKSGYSFDASDLNVPSISIGRMSGTQTVTREVTNVGRSTATYTATVSGLRGITTTVRPSRLTLAPGQTKSFKVTFSRTTAPLNTHHGGQLAWTDGRHRVRVPVVVRPVAEKWAATHGIPSGDDTAHRIALDPKGKRLYVAGTTYEQAYGLLKPRFATVAYDPVTGAELWSAGYTGPADRFDEPKAIGVSPDGSKVFVSGWSDGGDSGNDAVTLAYDAATGRKLWEARYNGEENGSDSVNALTVSRDGKRLYVTGLTTGADNDIDYVTIAYDADTGNKVWRVSYDGPGDGADDPRAIALSSDGTKVFVTGQSSGAGSFLADWGTVAYDARSGKQLWTAMFAGSADNFDLADDLVAGPNAVFVTGSAYPPGGNSDLVTIAYDPATGRELWTDRYDGPGRGTDMPRAIALAPDARMLFVTGNSEGEGTGHDFTTIAYDAATGHRAWVRRHNGAANGSDIAWGLAITPDKSKVIITGGSAEDAAKGDDYVTIAYDAASGHQVWSGRYDGLPGGVDTAYAVAADAAPGGAVRIFVTGASVAGVSVTGELLPDGREVDFTTVAYVERWRKP